MNPIALLSLDTKGRMLVLTPVEGGTLRRLETSLQKKGFFTFTAMRGLRQVHAPVEQLESLCNALCDWDLRPDKRTETILQALQAARERHQLGIVALRSLLAQEPGSLLVDYDGVDRLDPHQVLAVAALVHPDITGLCLFDEQGLGKTVTTLFSFDRLRKTGVQLTMIVVCPKNMLYEWSRDAARFFGRRYSVEVIAGSEKEKRRLLNKDADIYVTNFETVGRLYLRLRNLVRSFNRRVLLAVDESFFVKNPAALRTRALRSLRREVARCVVLCGTPAPNSAHDLVEQFNIADGGVTFAGVQVPVDRERARQVVGDRIRTAGLYLRRLKSDVLPSLPSKTFHKVLVPLELEQERAYRAALLGLLRDLQDVDEVRFRKNIASYLARRMALLQICSWPASVVDGYAQTPAKLTALDGILQELVAHRGEKVVVWSFFTSSLDAIVRRYRDYNPVRCDGTVTNAQDRREAVRRFQEDQSTMIFVANPAAAGAGITLHRARYAVYESMSNQAAHYLQSLDRIHRRGQERSVEYLLLLCDRTIELLEHDRLASKEAAAQQLLGDVVDPPTTRVSMLEEARAAAGLLEPLPSCGPAGDEDAQ